MQFGFPNVEYETRLARLHREMEKENIGAIFINTEHNFLYYTGFSSDFWQSPTRPWYLVIPINKKPIAIIPEIGKKALLETWIDDIHTWQAPNPKDDGISLLSDVIKSIVPAGTTLGIPLSLESHQRMPIQDYQRLLDNLQPIQVVDANQVLQKIRQIKSDLEIEKIAFACRATSKSFSQLREEISVSDSEFEICQKFKKLQIDHGLDSISYVAVNSGEFGYRDIISRASHKSMNVDSVLYIDSGCCFDHYFADFNRNFVFQAPNSTITKIHNKLYNAIDKTRSKIRIGMTMAEIFTEITADLSDLDQPPLSVGRMGHEIGLQLTEGASITPDDHTALKEGMVITLEPSICYDNESIMVLEENLVITNNGAEFLSERSDKIPYIIG